MMKALVWQGKNKVEMVEVPKPKIMEPRDVILKITGSTVCGSDLHLLHGTVVEMQKGDILGHEFCGVVDEVGSEVTNLKKGYVQASSSSKQPVSPPLKFLLAIY
jgi:threonine dehydrogenase-like Zn-dependent dehydrogenase